MRRGLLSVVALSLLAGLACVARIFAAPPEKAPAPSAEEIVSQLDTLFDEDEEGEVVVSPERFARVGEIFLGRKIDVTDVEPIDLRPSSVMPLSGAR